MNIDELLQDFPQNKSVSAHTFKTLGAKAPILTRPLYCTIQGRHYKFETEGAWLQILLWKNYITNSLYIFLMKNDWFVTKFDKNHGC